MCRKNLKRNLAFAAFPLLIASAVFATETPEAPAEKSGTAAETAHEKEMERLAEDKARWDARAAASTARKAASDAQSAAAASALGTLGSYEGAEGKVTVKDGTESVMEATLLSSLALRDVANRLGVRLCNVTGPKDRDGKPVACAIGADISRSIQDSPAARTERSGDQSCNATVSPADRALTGSERPIVIVPEASSGPIAAAVAFEVRAVGVGRRICSAFEEAERTTASFAALRSELEGAAGGQRAEGSGGTAALAAAGTAVDLVAKLFRTDYAIYGITVPPDQNLFVRELARAVRATNIANPIYAPTLFPVGQASPDNAAMVRLAALEELRNRTRTAAGEQRRHSKFFERALATAGARTAQVQEAKAAHDEAAKRLDDSADAYDAFVTGLTTGEGDQPPAMNAVLQEANTAALLRQGGLLVITKVHFIGGTSYTKQNFFTFLGGMPYHVSGGTLASYVVQDGRTSEVYDSMAVPVSGGYVRPTQLRRALQGQAAMR